MMKQPRPGLLLFSALVFCMSCLAWPAVLRAVSVAGDNHLDQKSREEIHALNTTIITSIQGNQPQVIYDLFIDDVRKQGIAPLQHLYNRISKVIGSKSFAITHDYTPDYSDAGSPILPMQFGSDPEYVLLPKDTQLHQRVVSFMESNGAFEDHALTFVYTRVDESWKLETFNLGIIRIAGKSPVDYYREAHLMYDLGHYVPALLRLSIASSFMHPAPFIGYYKAHDIRELIKKCEARISRHHFPLPLSIQGSPEIYGISPQFIEGDLYPMVKYITSTSIDKNEEITSEAGQMLPIVNDLFPGISSYGKYIAFRAYNEVPSDPKKKYETYGVVLEVK